MNNFLTTSASRLSPVQSEGTQTFRDCIDNPSLSSPTTEKVNTSVANKTGTEAGQATGTAELNVEVSEETKITIISVVPPP